MGSSSSENYDTPPAQQGPPIEKLQPAQKPVPPTSVLPSDPTQMATGLTPAMVTAMDQEHRAQDAAVQSMFAANNEPQQPAGREMLAAIVTAVAKDPALTRKLLQGGSDHAGYTTSGTGQRSSAYGGTLS